MTSGALVTEPGCFSRIWLHKVCFRYVLFLSHRHGMKRIESRKSYKLHIYLCKKKRQLSTETPALDTLDCFVLAWFAGECFFQATCNLRVTTWQWCGFDSTGFGTHDMETTEGLQWVYCSLFAKICWEKKDLVEIRVEQNSYQVVKVQTNKNTEKT